MSRHGTCGASATRTRAGAGDSGARLSCQGLVSRVFLKRFGVTWIFEAKLVSGSSDASEICMCFSRSACQAVGLETEVPVSPAARQPGLLPFHCGDPAGTPVHCPAPLPLRGLCGERREQSHLRWPPWPCSAGLASGSHCRSLLSSQGVWHLVKALCCASHVSGFGQRGSIET